MCNQTPNFCHWLRCDSCPPTTRPRYARHLKRRLEILMYDMLYDQLFDRDDTVTVTLGPCTCGARTPSESNLKAAA